MREILFRGKATMSEKEMEEMNLTHSNGWVYGNLIKDGDLTFIVGPIADWDSDFLAHEWWLLVGTETVGQYTEISGNKNFKKIYEGDIVNGFCSGAGRFIGVVYGDRGEYRVRGGGNYKGMVSMLNQTFNVIGNEIDNPELLNN